MAAAAADADTAPAAIAAAVATDDEDAAEGAAEDAADEAAAEAAAKAATEAKAKKLLADATALLAKIKVLADGDEGQKLEAVRLVLVWAGKGAATSFGMEHLELARGTIGSYHGMGTATLRTKMPTRSGKCEAIMGKIKGLKVEDLLIGARRAAKWTEADSLLIYMACTRDGKTFGSTAMASGTLASLLVAVNSASDRAEPFSLNQLKGKISNMRSILSGKRVQGKCTLAIAETKAKKQRTFYDKKVAALKKA